MLETLGPLRARYPSRFETRFICLRADRSVRYIGRTPTARRHRGADLVTTGRQRAHLRSLDSSAKEPSDAELLERIRDGDERALDLLMDRYWGELHAYLDRLLLHPDLAEDLVQETFVRLWARRETWQPEGSLRGLLYQIGRRLAFDERKRHRRLVARLLPWRNDSSSPTPEDVLDRTELELAVTRAIAALPERRRLAFLMARWEGLSHREIAAALGISVQTVANQLSFALAQLRSVLRPFLGSR